MLYRPVNPQYLVEHNVCKPRGALDWVGKMRMAVSTELVPAILAFKAEVPASATLAAEAKVRACVRVWRSQVPKFADVSGHTSTYALFRYTTHSGQKTQGHT